MPPNLPISSKDDLNKSSWENIHFGGLEVWNCVNHLDDHPFFQKHPFRQVAFILFIL